VNYSGDAVYESGVGFISVTVNSSGTIQPTVTVITPSAPVSNAQFSVTVTVSGPSGDPVPTGTIYLANNTYGYSNSAALTNGSATFTMLQNNYPPGPLTFTSTYLGDSNYTSGSGTGTVTIMAWPTITFSPSAPTIVVNQPLSMTVTVATRAPFPAPTGTVTLSSGTYTSSPTPLTAGSASFTIPANSLALGSDTLIATYSGDTNYTSGNNINPVTVNGIISPSIAFSPVAPTIAVNQTLNTTVAVSGATGSPAATGTITLSSGTYTSLPIQLTAGSARFTIPANTLPVGADTLTASYSGDSNYMAGSYSEAVTVTAAVPPGFAITGTPVYVAPGATSGNTSTITVTPVYGFTGTVNLSCAISPTAASDPATCSLSPASVAITDTSAQTSTLTVSTTAAYGSTLVHPKLPGVPWYAAGGATLACLLLFGIPARRRRWRTLLGMLVLLVILSGGVFACGGGGSAGGGGGGNSGTTAGTYTITVTGTSGSLTATGVINLTVQ
jgi:hypothetical protein